MALSAKAASAGEARGFLARIGRPIGLRILPGLEA